MMTVTEIMSKKTQGKFVVMLLALVFISISATGSESGQPNCSCDRNVHALVSKKGWVVPGLDGASVSSPRSVYTGAGPRVFATKLKPGPIVGSIVIVQCNDEANAVQLQTIDVEVLELWAFDIDGKAFAYGLTVGWLDAPDAAGQRVKIGTASDVIFYDQEGTGRFTLMRHTKSPFKLDIPSWTRSKNN